MQNGQGLIEVHNLLTEIRSCAKCSGLPLGPRPIIQCHPDARLLIAGQAPGRITHHKGVPFDDPSGNRLRDWLGIGREVFYDETQCAIVPMAFCYPGTGEGGDLSPPPLCADSWREKVLKSLPNLELILVIGKHAMDWHLGKEQAKTVTDTVRQWQHYWPEIMPLPHPSPRNNRWLKNNPWFAEQLLPVLKKRVSELVRSD